MAELLINVGNCGLLTTDLMDASINIALSCGFDWIRSDIAINEALSTGPGATPNFTAIDNLIDRAATTGLKLLAMTEFICPPNDAAWTTLAGVTYGTNDWRVWKRPPTQTWDSISDGINWCFERIVTRWTQTHGRSKSDLLFQIGNERNLTGAGGIVGGTIPKLGGGTHDESVIKTRATESSFGGYWDNNTTWDNMGTLYPGNGYENTIGNKECWNYIFPTLDFQGVEGVEAAFETQTALPYWDQRINLTSGNDHFDQELTTTLNSGSDVTYMDTPMFLNNINYLSFNCGLGKLPVRIMTREEHSFLAFEKAMRVANKIRDEHPQKSRFPLSKFIISEWGFPLDYLNFPLRVKSYTERGRFVAELLSTFRGLPFKIAGFFAAQNYDLASNSTPATDFGLANYPGTVWTPSIPPVAKAVGNITINLGSPPPSRFGVSASWATEIV